MYKEDVMKILHTSDLHLGKNLSDESFYEDQKYILDEIIKVVKEKEINVVLIPGDIYDKSIPSSEATMLFDSFLTKLSKMNVETLIISGNHDSNERLSFGSNIFKELNIHIVTKYEGKIEKISIDDVDFYLLPFLKPFHIKHLMTDKEYESINNSNDMMKWILSKESIDKSKKNILLAHQFIMWDGKMPEQCDSESISLTNVGTLDGIDVNLLDDFDYVALGHIHRPQKIKRDTVRYSVTPLKYSFSETNDKKSVVIIDTDNINNIELVELKPLRDMKVLRGTFEQIMNSKPSDEIIKVELEDENTIISPMEEIKKRFKNAISLVFINKYESSEEELGEIKEDATPYELFSSFFREQNGRDMNEDEDEYIKSIIESLKEDE
jgi:exonuclease SbcD